MYKFIPYSYSKISTYNSCPKKFKYQYIDKLSGDLPPSDALVKGKTIHYIIENWYLSQDEYEEEMKNNIQKFPEVLTILENFKNSELGIKYLKEIDKPALNEVKIGITTDLKSNDYEKTNLFNGIIDYICIKDNELYICDFKSGKFKPQMYQDYNQLLFYALYFFIRNPEINKINITYLYVEHNLENEMTLTRDNFNNYLKHFLLNIKTIETDLEFKENRTRLCDYCDFQELCEIKA